MSKKRPVGPPEVHFRDISKEDVVPVRLLHNASFPVMYGDDFYKSLFTEPHRHTILATVPAENVIGYEIIGVLTYRIKKRTKSVQRITEWWNGFTTGTHAYIMTLAVATDFRRRGIARMLLEKMLDQLRQCDITQVSLHMLTTNVAALRLYSAYGFSILCMIREYYELEDGPKDAYWMRKDMTKQLHISESPIFAPSVREGPWPLGLNFLAFTMLIFAIFSMILFVALTQWAKFRK